MAKKASSKGKRSGRGVKAGMKAGGRGKIGLGRRKIKARTSGRAEAAA